MTLDELKEKLKTDRVARFKYVESAIEFFEKNGVVVDETLLKSFDEDAIKAVTGGAAAEPTLSLFFN
ncbi:hypothetical protein HH213_08605 [Duganella dendranthematis]|uniref:Nif11-like leader peptide family natural product n=1 Tax=Duganella dendranthematis TaxID=2728021 RepID=A0ABX6M813_9BURK|nr:hypothetical protein [Duganella dendranthematis]QJD90151.1 hypothetical protein HH213_08605 [Duganella dendranthematis]